mmetsp:Transcript_6815/g.13155  ORF Transcript_6815/g.13155 Transcript_6815/m.13155 type:complete len:103 (+) Transcript_6815:60-368(+)
MDWTPQECVECKGTGTCDCAACSGTSFMMLGDEMLCGVDGVPITDDRQDTADMEFNHDDVVCARGINYREARAPMQCQLCNEGEVGCAKCSGTGKIAAWMNK